MKRAPLTQLPCRPVLLLLLLLLLLLMITGCQGARRGRIPGDVYDMYGISRPTLWNRMAGKFKLLLHQTKPEFPQWKSVTEKKHGEFSIEDRVRHMEQLDRQHEFLYQQHLLEHTPLLVISPTLAAVEEGSPSGGYSILYPMVYAGDTYNIAFKIGKLYSLKRPYLSIFLTVCNQREKPEKNGIRFIRTVYVQPDLQVTDHDDQHEAYDSWRSPYASEDIQQASNGAWFFRWSVPLRGLFPSAKYCLLFDMSSVNPASIMDAATTGNQLFYNLRDFKPGYFFDVLQTTKQYHRIVASPRFDILQRPPMYSEDWFSRLFGGRDLVVFMGGKLYSFRYFDVMYYHDKGAWNQALFHRDVRERARSVGQWLADNMRSNTNAIDDSSAVARIDTGFSDFQDRKEARSRAIGLLFHPRGRQTLKYLGDGFLRVAGAYTTTLKSYGRYNDFFLNKIMHRMKQLYDEYLGEFARSRRKLAFWIKELKRLLGGNPPDEETLATYNQNFLGQRRMYVREFKEYIYSPAEIQRKIEKHMDVMVRHEIKLVIWAVGNTILQRRTTGDRWVETFFGTSPYNYAKYVDFASTLKVVGTKFATMSNCFEFEVVSERGQQLSIGPAPAPPPPPPATETLLRSAASMIYG